MDGGPGLPVLLLVHGMAGGAPGKRFPSRGLRGGSLRRMPFPRSSPHPRMAPETQGIPAFPQEVFPDPSMGPVTLPAPAFQKSGAVDSPRPGGMSTVASRTHGISPLPEGNPGAGEDTPASFFVGGVTTGTTFFPRVLSPRYRGGMLGAAPQGIPAVPYGPVVAASAHPFLVEPTDLFREGETFVEKDALPDVAKGAGFLGIDLLTLGPVNTG